MTKRNKIDKIRDILSNPPIPKIDLSKWSDEDLLQVVAMQDKTEITAEDQISFEILLQKYTTHEN